MEPLLLIIRWPLLILACLSAAYWLIVLLRIARAVRTVPTVRAGLDFQPAAGAWPKVSIIVPAHNEESVIESCALSLACQDYPALEIIFVLDRCTDRTRERLDRLAARDRRIQLIENSACPADWAGKCYAAHVGAERAIGDWVLFTDADTVFDPLLIRAAVGIAMLRQLDLVSLLSTLTTDHWFERIVQPVASMNLVRMFPLDRVNRAETKRNFANGQFLLFRREIYDRVGGHRTVKDDLLEDISFARHVRRRGGRGGLFFDDGMLRVSMYESFRAFREGWKRIYIEACKRKPARVRKNAVRLAVLAIGEPALRGATVLLMIWSFLSGEISWGVIFASATIGPLALKSAALALGYRLCGAPLRAVALYSFGAWSVARILFEAANDLRRRRPIRWAGREYVLEPR